MAMDSFINGRAAAKLVITLSALQYAQWALANFRHYGYVTGLDSKLSFRSFKLDPQARLSVGITVFVLLNVAKKRLDAPGSGISGSLDERSGVAARL